MGQGYIILVWDSFGSGLVRVNARLHSEDKDMYHNERNWWPCNEDTTPLDVVEKHKLYDIYPHGNFTIYFDKNE